MFMKLMECVTHTNIVTVIEGLRNILYMSRNSWQYFFVSLFKVNPGIFNKWLCSHKPNCQ